MRLLFPVIIICLFALNTTNAQENDTTDVFFQFDSPNFDTTYTNNYEIIDPIISMPIFPEVEEDLLEYIDTTYNPQAYSSNTVFISFIVETDGSITDIKQAEGTFCEDEEMVEKAISIVEEFPNFTPANIQGVAVRVTYVIPMNFY